jgi:hypothetical protein
MKLVFIILCFLWVSGVQAEEPKIPEINEIINWIPEEVPRTVSFYIDTNRDNLVDVIITYSLIEAYACKDNCVYKITDNGDHWLLPGDHYVYYVIKRWTYWKYVDDEDWRGLEKTSGFMFKYKTHKEWYENRYLKLHPE